MAYSKAQAIHESSRLTPPPLTGETCGDALTVNVNVVYTGRSYQTAESLPQEITLADGAALGDALRAIGEFLPDGQELPATCLVSVAGQHRGTVAAHSNDRLADGDELVLIAPVAGG